MNTPPKYEDLVLKVTEMGRRETALREELEAESKGADRAAECLMKWRRDCIALQQRLSVAENRAGVMEKALMRIARPHDCGCLPCTGDCTSKLSLEITVDDMRETAELALKPAEVSRCD